MSVNVETFGTAKVDEERINASIKAVFPVRPKGLIAHLNLLRPIYQQTAAYGHFGRSGDDFTWERTDRVELVKQALGL